MLKYRGGDTVKPGFYWNRHEWEAQAVGREGGVLAGDGGVHYVRLPMPAVLVLAPIMGAVYAFFLPFIGFAMVMMYLAGRLRRLFTTRPPEAAKSMVVPPRRRQERPLESATDEDLRKAA